MSPEECDHIISLAHKEGLEMSTTVGDIEDELQGLGHNTDKFFTMWDLNKDGKINVEEVKLKSIYSHLRDT